MTTQYQVIIMTEEHVGPTCRQTYDADARLEVRELSTRMTIVVRAKELSPYRHTLLLEGKGYQIINMIRQG